MKRKGVEKERDFAQNCLFRCLAQSFDDWDAVSVPKYQILKKSKGGGHTLPDFKLTANLWCPRHKGGAGTRTDVQME